MKDFEITFAIATKNSVQYMPIRNSSSFFLIKKFQDNLTTYLFFNFQIAQLLANWVIITSCNLKENSLNYR